MYMYIPILAMLTWKKASGEAQVSVVEHKFYIQRREYWQDREGGGLTLYIKECIDSNKLENIPRINSSTEEEEE